MHDWCTKWIPDAWQDAFPCIEVSILCVPEIVSRGEVRSYFAHLARTMFINKEVGDCRTCFRGHVNVIVVEGAMTSVFSVAELFYVCSFVDV